MELESWLPTALQIVSFVGTAAWLIANMRGDTRLLRQSIDGLKETVREVRGLVTELREKHVDHAMRIRLLEAAEQRREVERRRRNSGGSTP